jgi:hypothetical protein
VGYELKHESYLIQQKEQGSGTPIRKRSPVIIKKKENPHDLHGGGTARRTMIYRAVPDS